MDLRPLGNKKIFHARYLDEMGNRISRSTGTASEREATILALRWEEDARKLRNGLGDPQATRHALQGARSVLEHLAEFIARKKSEGQAPLFVKQSEAILKKFFTATGVFYLADITPTRYATYVNQLSSKSLRPGVDGLSTSTVNWHRAILRRFCEWATDDGRLPDNPLRKVKKCKSTTRPRRPRRALTIEEVDWLIHTTAKLDEPLKRKMTPAKRAALYAAAAYTGLRAGALCRLLRQDFDFKAMVIRVPAALAKNRKESIVPMRSGLAEYLRPVVEGAKEGLPVFEGALSQTAHLIDADARPGSRPARRPRNNPSGSSRTP
jgi:integrase